MLTFPDLYGITNSMIISIKGLMIFKPIGAQCRVKVSPSTISRNYVSAPLNFWTGPGQLMTTHIMRVII